MNDIRLRHLTSQPKYSRRNSLNQNFEFGFINQKSGKCKTDKCTYFNFFEKCSYYYLTPCYTRVIMWESGGGWQCSRQFQSWSRHLFVAVFIFFSLSVVLITFTCCQLLLLLLQGERCEVSMLSLGGWPPLRHRFHWFIILCKHNRITITSVPWGRWVSTNIKGTQAHTLLTLGWHAHQNPL